MSRVKHSQDQRQLSPRKTTSHGTIQPMVSKGRFKQVTRHMITSLVARLQRPLGFAFAKSHF